MRSRKYTKIIEIWQNIEVADGFGGYTVTPQLIRKSWANVKSVSSNSRYTQRLTDLGITDPANALIFELRYRNDTPYNAINQYIQYRGENYVIQNLPNNIDFKDVDIEIIAIRQTTDEVDVLIPLGINLFDDTFDTTFN